MYQGSISQVLFLPKKKGLEALSSEVPLGVRLEGGLTGLAAEVVGLPPHEDDVLLYSLRRGLQAGESRKTLRMFEDLT